MDLKQIVTLAKAHCPEGCYPKAAFSLGSSSMPAGYMLEIYKSPNHALGYYWKEAPGKREVVKRTRELIKTLME